MKLPSKSLAAALALLLIPTALAEEKAPPTLDTMLDERITLNAQYGEEYAELAEESEFAEDLVPLEKQLGDSWVTYLKYIRASQDPKLKAQTLRLEYLDELRGCYYSLESAESFIEKVNLRAEIASWKKLLTQLDSLAVTTLDEK